MRKKYRTIYKSALTGRFVSRAFAEANPDTTIVQKVLIKPEAAN